jgi:hypothetical protein
MEIGSGPCPCSAGRITVERCIPDHPWSSGFWYESRLVCGICETQYVLLNLHGDMPHRLVLRSDVEKKEAATMAWYRKLRAVEVTLEFIAARATLDAVLAQQKSTAAKYRILRQAGLIDVTEGTFRRRSSQYRFTASNAARAMAAIGMPVPALESHAGEIAVLAKAMEFDPPAVATGISGLEK